MMDQLFPVPFYEDTLVLVDHDGKPFVAMKPIVENMGLAWQVQHRKLTEKFGSTITIMVTVGEDGKQREMVCLPLRKIPAFLYSVNPNKVKPALRDKIVRYQGECDDALWDYWTKGSATRSAAAAIDDVQFIRLHRMATTLLKQLQRETDAEARRFIHEQLAGVSTKLGLQVPAIEKIGHEAAPDYDSPALEEFWEVFEMLESRAQNRLNHSRDRLLTAINLPSVRAAATAAKLALPDMGELRRVLKACRAPRFVGVKTVNSKHTGGSVKCWVFENVISSSSTGAFGGSASNDHAAFYSPEGAEQGEDIPHSSPKISIAASTR